MYSISPFGLLVPIYSKFADKLRFLIINSIKIMFIIVGLCRKIMRLL